LDQADYKGVALRIAEADGPIAWSWMALREADGSWRVPLLSVRGATRTPQVRLVYRRLMLGCLQLSPRQASRRFLRRIVQPKTGPDAALKVEIPTHAERPLWITTEPDYGYYLSPPGQWPTYMINFNLHEQFALPGLLDPLKGKGVPYYPTLQGAVAEILYGLPPRTLGATIAPNVLVRLPDLRARLTVITSKDGLIRVGVEEGKAGGVAGCRVEAAWRNAADDSVWNRSATVIRRPREVAFRVGRLPEEMWILLSDSDGSALDRRGWSAEIGTQLNTVGPLSARVERWITEGEHYRLEYKRELGGPKVNESFAETVAAFANGDGGVVLIGVDDDSRVIGYDQSKARDQIIDIVRTYVADPVAVTVERVVMPNRKPIWVVTVPRQANTAKPFRCSGRVVVRANGTTRVATTAEHRSIVGDSTAQGSRLGPSWWVH